MDQPFYNHTISTKMKNKTQKQTYHIMRQTQKMEGAPEADEE